MMTRQHGFHPGDRYRYDFNSHSAAKGWGQIDTRQDASYFGQWINPQLRQIFCYCEGDTYLTTCADDAELRTEMHKIREFHNEDHGGFLGIDPGFNSDLRAALIAAGLREFFHASDRDAHQETAV